MTNEEFLRLFDDLVNNFDDYSLNESRRIINDLRNYARDYLKSDNLADDLQRASDVVYGTVQANPNEPKDIVLSSRQKVDDRVINGDDESNYYKNLDRKVVSEYFNKQNSDEKPALDRSMYIPGTDILKPRNRGVFETDEEYVKYLEDYYAKYFPNSNEKGLSVLKEQPKGLAVLEDVKKPESIEKLENVINSDSNVEDKKDEDFESDFVGIEGLDIDEDSDSINIFSNSDGTSASIAKEIEEEKKKKEQSEKASGKDIDSDDKSDVIEFDSDEEREAFEKDQGNDYSKDKNSKTKKISKIRKATRKFKEVFKKHGKKIIAGVLVGVTTIFGVMSIKSCGYDKKDDLNENKENPKSNTDEYDGTIPSVEAAESIEKSNDYETSYDDTEVNSDDIINKISANKDDIKTNEDYSATEDTYNVDSFEIGDTLRFNGDYIYATSKDAATETNKLTPYYSNNDEREFSAIHLIGPNGEQKTVTTPGEVKQLENQGWKVESYNMQNNSHNTQYEGWVNVDDVSKVK